MAFLKGLELQGFKSFAGKTVLEFPSRVVAVVGPNGSGKSNIIDAFRWVLGEREAKQLRGATLENLIFAGTPKKPAVSLARVGLLFDNKDKMFDVPDNEVLLERRIDRSGTSQFFLNGDEMRLKDLTPMLARAKLGARGITMIGQGQSDVFVKSSPDARRVMIEEILGLKEFRIKKAQAERRLVSSRVNMDKVKAMLEELLPHLKLLRRQKNRWDRRSEIENSLRELEDGYYSFQYNKLKKETDELGGPSEALLSRKKEEEEIISKIETRIRGIDTSNSNSARSRDVRIGISELFKKRTAIASELAKAEVRIEMSEREEKIEGFQVGEVLSVVGNLKNDIDGLLDLGDIERIKNVLREWSNKLARFFSVKPKADNNNLIAEKIKTEKEIEAIDLEIKALRDEEEKIAREQDSANVEFRRLIEELEMHKNAVRKIERDIQEQSFARERLRIRQEELIKDWVSIGRRMDELQDIRVSTADWSVSETERKMMHLRGELASIGEVDENLVNEARESEERYEFLSKELNDLEGAVGDLKKLIVELDRQIDTDFRESFRLINDEFNNYFRLMFGGGKARMKIERKKVETVPSESGEDSEIAENILEDEDNDAGGVEIELSLPKKKINNLDMLSGGEKSLVSIAALFALISVAPPPFLVLDEVDAPLDESNARRFADLIKEFSTKTQFIIVTHNRATMEAADVLYGVTMADDGVSKLLSLKLEGE